MVSTIIEGNNIEKEISFLKIQTHKRLQIGEHTRLYFMYVDVRNQANIEIH